MLSKVILLVIMTFDTASGGFLYEGIPIENMAECLEWKKVYDQEEIRNPDLIQQTYCVEY